MESLVLFQPVTLRGKKQWSDALAAVVAHNNRSLELLSRQTNTVACTYSCCAFCLSMRPASHALHKQCRTRKSRDRFPGKNTKEQHRQFVYVE